MSRWARVAALAVLAVACDRGSPVDNTPAATPTPPAVTLPPGPMPIEAAEVAPTPPPSAPRPRNPAPPGPGGPAPGIPCGSPEVTITQPTAGQSFSGGSTQINAVAGSSVARVDFYYHIDSAGVSRDPAVLIGVRNGPPWRVNWGLPNICNSSVRVFGIGWDSCGNVADSNWVTVRVCR
jgi:hypothetical protein